MYQLDYLPIAMQDMAEIAKYISHEIRNPQAAEKLAREMIEAADRLTEYPYANAMHTAVRPLKREYRKLTVRNYIMFYWVEEKEKRIRIARVIYAGRNYEGLLQT